MEQLYQKNVPVNIEDEMKKSYMDYAMSVIIGRAIPDVRDGLKPVHRRVLYAMSEMGNVWNKAYKKSARIVGDIIGKYHPHGDAAAYDTIVRMAQDFSMRYPLIDGQGNFGCFTGDTKIKLLDGTERSFQELSSLNPDDVFYVYSVDKNGRIVVGEGKNARVTRRKAQLLEMTLDNGHRIRCTPDHRFLLRDGSYKEARTLTPEDSLMAGYFDSVPVKEGLNEYLRIRQPATGEYEFVHHLADEFNTRKGKARKIKGPFVRHHRNFNRLDNRPDNISRMAFLEHLPLHAEQMDALREDEAFRNKQREGVQKYYKENPEAVEDRRRRRISQNKSQEFRKVLGTPRGVCKRELTPEEKKRAAQMISEKSRALCSDDSRSKVARYVSGLLRERSREDITPQFYEEHRNANWIPEIGKALSHFDSFDEMLDHAATYNHRVVSIRWLQDRADTYDLEVKEHHNFLLAASVFVHNSVDGDPPAAMRYTEIRMARLAEELLADLEKDTVDFVPNYDASLKEPVVLPSRVPALLLNGSSGIAVGVATNIPPHNLGELISGTIALVRNPEITIDELMRFIKGPDFPTAGFINGREGIVSAYRTGRGSIRIRARAIIERNARNDRESIIITELPYLVNKANLLEKISELVKEKKVNGIADLRDESDREGIRIVIDLKKDEAAAVILNQLYKHTQMESSFGIIMLSIDRGQPRVLNLKDVLQRFIDFRKEVITRRTIFDLARARERAHILEGLIIALNNIDAVVALIKASRSPQEASEGLCRKFGLSEIQAKAILEMRLQRLTGLERDKIDGEYKELTGLIRTLQGILDDPRKVLNIIVEELEEIRRKYGDERRTEIVANVDDIDIEDMIVEEDMAVTVSHYGYIKRNPVSLYRSQHRGGRGKMGMVTKDEDFVEDIFVASTHSYILIFTSLGRIHWLKVYQVPQAGRAAKGKAIVNLIQISPQERVSAILPVREFVDGKYVVMVTRKGIIKKTDLAAFSNPRSGGIIALTLDEGDELIDVKETLGDQDIFLGTRKGMAIRFREEDARPMGRTARGVIGIRMDDDDELVGMEIIGNENSIMTVSEKGFGKRTEIAEYRLQARGGRGIINLKTTPKIGFVSGIKQVTGNEDIMLITNTGNIIRLRVDEIRILHRNTQGVKLIEIAAEEEKVVGMARTERESVREGEKEEEGEAGAAESGDTPA